MNIFNDHKWLNCCHLRPLVVNNIELYQHSDIIGGNKMKTKLIIPAEVGETIEWENKLFNVMVEGVVLKRYQNSVCVQILDYTQKHREMYENDRTVVSHKHYTILNSLKEVTRC
jgi:uncharacterized protein YkvS